jgi:hypothetical protein
MKLFYKISAWEEMAAAEANPGLPARSIRCFSAAAARAGLAVEWW